MARRPGNACNLTSNGQRKWGRVPGAFRCGEHQGFMGCAHRDTRKNRVPGTNNSMVGNGTQVGPLQDHGHTPSCWDGQRCDDIHHRWRVGSGLRRGRGTLLTDDDIPTVLNTHTRRNKAVEGCVRGVDGTIRVGKRFTIHLADSEHPVEQERVGRSEV